MENTNKRKVVFKGILFVKKRLCELNENDLNWTKRGYLHQSGIVICDDNAYINLNASVVKDYSLSEGFVIPITIKNNEIIILWKECRVSLYRESLDQDGITSILDEGFEGPYKIDYVPAFDDNYYQESRIRRMRYNIFKNEFETICGNLDDKIPNKIYWESVYSSFLVVLEEKIKRFDLNKLESERKYFEDVLDDSSHVDEIFDRIINEKKSYPHQEYICPDKKKKRKRISAGIPLHDDSSYENLSQEEIRQRMASMTKNKGSIEIHKILDSKEYKQLETRLINYSNQKK
ncbi:TPA: hypothetical protein DEP21_05300 [Patescibacteria group bacterium]|nr:hypothetical protein [Candidatus Gracilibacteria bacterium]